MSLLNAYCTHRAPPPLEFPHALRGRRDRSDLSLDSHLQGFAGFITAGGTRPMTATRYAVLQHLQRVQHHLSVEVPDTSLVPFEAWARVANAIVFRPDGSVRAPGGGVLVDPQTGEAHPGASVPFPMDAVRRKTASDAAVAALGLHVPASLPPVVSELEVELRSGPDVAARCLALFACAVRAESLTAGDGIPESEIRHRMPLALAAMSPAELAFLATAQPERQQVSQHVWRYEALAALAWAIGLIPEPPIPTSTCDVPALATLILTRNESDAAAFIAGARLRTTDELLAALDLTFRLHWVVTDARLKSAPPPAGLEPGVVFERHRAFNWLTRFGDAAWDEVDTPT